MVDSNPPKIEKLEPAKQQLLDRLLEQNAEDTITAADKAQLAALVAEAEALIVKNSQRMADFARSQSPGPPAGAVPVTIWVNVELAGS